MFVEWTWLVGFYLGATFGSFLNVVIYRLPRSISLSNPPKSYCPRCKHSLGALDLFPLLSWVLLRGRCRYCGAPVSSRYFFVELLNGAIWAGIWWEYLIARWAPGTAIAYAAAASALVAVIFIDWELYIIPDQINAFLLFTGIGYNVYLYSIGDPRAVTGNLPSSLVGALVGVLALWGIAFLGRLLFRKDAMGHGDIKMARGIGAVLFVGPALMSFALAVVLGAVLGVAQVVLMKPPEGDTAKGAEGDEALLDEDAEPEPESISSLLRCGLGYVLCIDVIGLFFPKLYMAWFNEDPFAPIDEMDDFEVERTMIPFGPYLALGAIAATVFQGPLLGGWDAYTKWVRGSPGMVEHLWLFGSLF